MTNKKGLGVNGLPTIKNKSILQQVMKPKDWLFLFVLIIVSATCWLWVLSAYQDSITVDDIINPKINIDKKV